MKWRRTTLRHSLLAAALVVVLQFFLQRWLADRNIVAVLFAANDHVPAGKLLLAFLFVAIRFFACLVLPGLIARDLLYALWRDHRETIRSAERTP